MDFNQARELLQRYRNGKCSQEEIQLIEQWYDQLVESGEAQIDGQQAEELQQAGENRLLEQINAQQDSAPASIRQFRPIRWAAAAAIIFALGTGSYFLLHKTKSPTIETAPAVAAVTDIKAPESNRATITLANGQQVYLDESGDGELATQGNVKILRSANGDISYQASRHSNEIHYNTLNNPRGSKVASITLADGTRVWLNSGSTLTFPAAFTGRERKVSVTGEAYFEVAKDKYKPFFVTKDAVTIQVLGTHFNVNAYDDESTNSITLLEGKVKVSHGAKDLLLEPGQQAQVSANSSKVINDADLNEVMAWKDGLFIFKGEDIQTIMRQLARWYNVDVEFEKEVKEKFYVKMDRNTNVSNVFKILETTGGVHFKINGNKIMVKP
ncbi:FecR family protein [Flavihumibacter solisilvae]|uniref:FecR family protein n=1 Tax=Flavihumibacter solisilvae TaxID=1349421 RepID=A0A0C1LKL1_9BACT|nr:FecR family protein [Flavihumibacter solisilvae]KIC95908.1 hypothetical protein OI18_03200 [Flavihumibacter solisilvae]